jgi:ParB family chromosome partitioning protein
MTAQLIPSRQLLAIPDQFRQTALSFPARIDEALALIDSPDQAKGLLDQADTLAYFAKRVKADTEITNAIQYGKLKIVAKLGELMPAPSASERGAQGGRGKKAPSPNEGAFASETRSRYRKVAANKNAIDEYYHRAQSRKGTLEEVTIGGFLRFATGTEKARLAAHVSANTGIPEWYTPERIIEAAREVLGEIDLDPASSAIAQRTVRARDYFTLDDDGLSKAWFGRIWLNPPYAADLVTKFVGKLCDHIEAGHVTQAILLVNNATETKWFQRAGHLATAISFPAGRVKFLDENGNEKGAPLQGQAILYFGASIDSFRRVFGPFGFCR